MNRSFVRRWFGVLVMVMSVTVIAGLLGAAVPARAAVAASTGDVTLTFDPGTDPGYGTSEAGIQAAIDQIQRPGGTLGDEIKRMVEEYTPDLPVGSADSENTSQWVDFDGVLSASSDGTGVSLTIPASEAQTYTAIDWEQIWAALAWAGTWLIVRPVCVALLTLAYPAAAVFVAIICGYVAGFVASMVRSIVLDGFANTLTSPTAWATAIIVGIITAIPTGLWEAGINNWAAGVSPGLPNGSTGLPKLLRYIGSWFGGSGASLLASVTSTATTAAMVSIGTFLDSIADALPGTAAAASPPAAPSGQACDAYTFYGTPCTAAYSTVHAMYSTYDGPLYQVQRGSDGTTADIGLLSTGGYVNASEQDSFCFDTSCTITKLYDQSPSMNDLTVAAGDTAASATALKISAGGNEAYGVDITPGDGYRNNDTQYIATGNEPEGMYMVASGTNVNSGCCFDFGNAETNAGDNGDGHMDAVNFSTSCEFSPCAGGGPWVQADLENGLFQGANGSNLANTGNGSDFVTAMLKNDGQTTYALKGGDAQGGGLTTWWDGGLPTIGTYIPMSKEGAIIMGTGGDNSHSDVGSFFEGAMTTGYPSDAAENAVQSAVVSVGYGGNSGGSGLGLNPPAGTITMAGGNCVDVSGDDDGTDGSVVDSWSCQATAVDQHWVHNANGSLETLGRCLNISIAQGVGGTGTAVAGDHTTLWDCNGSGVEQWVAQPNGTLYNPPSGLCLYGQPSDGYQLQVQPCNASDPDQQFSVNGGSPVTNVSSGMCVDVLGDDTGTDGTPVDLWDCQPTAVDQHWVYNSGTEELETLGRCLNISIAQGVGGTGTAVAGDHTTLWDCNGSGVEQWVAQPNGTLYNPPSGLCLYGQPSDGYQLQVQPCNASDPDQQFASAGGGSGPLATPAGTITMAGGMCVDVSGDDDGTDGSVVDSWDCQADALDQHWTHNANGSLETLGLCLDVSIAQGVGGTGTAVPGDHTTLWDCNGSGVEQWVQQPDGTLENLASGLCLYGQPSDGYQLQVQDCDPSDPDQQFAVNGGSPITTDALSGMCIDVLGDDTGSDGTPVDLWDCQASAADQHWVYNSAAETLETLGRCLNVSIAQGVGGTGTAVAGDHTTLWDCNGSGVEQWVAQPDGTLYNPPSGLCLYGQSSDGYQLQVQPCDDGDLDQQFFAYIPGPAFVQLHSGQCVDVLGDDTGTDGTPVDLWNCQPTAADQHWTYASDNTLQTLGRCLSVSVAQGVGGTGTAVSGDHVVLWDCNGSGVEQWTDVGGTWVNPASGLCLDDPDDNTANGWQLDVESCSGDPDQIFIFDPEYV
jgi:hypothetical protein